MKHILVVFTGGTIGSVASEGTIKPSESAPFKLLGEFQRRFPETAKEIVLEFLQKYFKIHTGRNPMILPVIVEV